MKKTTLKFIDVTYYSHTEFTAPLQVLERHKESLGYIDFIKKYFEVEVIKHLNYEGFERKDGVRFCFFKSRNRFSYVPLKTHNYIKRARPDVVLIQGLIFPLQVIALRLQLGKKPLFLVQHHGEIAFTGWGKLLQTLADKCINAYLFTALGNAKSFVENKVIKNYSKCFEVLEASTNFTAFDKQQSRLKTGMNGENIFLWAGRLDNNKDPLTVLKGFEKYIQLNNDAHLYMVYQTEDVLSDVKEFIYKSGVLKNTVRLVGKVPHEKLVYWFSGADFYISGSHKESTGFGLVRSNGLRLYSCCYGYCFLQKAYRNREVWSAV